MRKKGMEMSMNVIIIAAIGLLILIILAFLVVKKVGQTNTATESCIAKGGTCQNSGSCTTTIPTTDCTSGKVCCPVIPGIG
jgi:predicted permease